MMDLRQFPQNPKALLIEAKDKIIALEAELAEAREASRLQQALGKIKAAGYSYELHTSLGVTGISLLCAGTVLFRFGINDDCAYSPAEVVAAEAAAAWAESQKEAAHE